MTIIMTVADVDCDAKVLDNEITCRIPKNITIPSEGLPVKVGQIAFLWKSCPPGSCCEGNLLRHLLNTLLVDL